MMSSFIDTLKLLRSLQIRRSDLVLEIGSGSNPFLRSDVLLDKYPIISKEHRSNLKVAEIHKRPFVLGDAEELPFLNNSFDFIIARHVLEHLNNPRKFIGELKRISKGAFIATPSPFTELVHGGYRKSDEIRKDNQLNCLHHGIGTEGHKWFVLAAENKIYMLAKEVEFYPIYLLFGYFVKKDTDYKKTIFFKKNPKWRETRLICRNMKNLELIMLNEPRGKTDDSIDTRLLISNLRKITHHHDKNHNRLIKTYITQRFIATKRRFDVYQLIACPICKNKLIAKDQRLICTNCGHFPLVNNIPILLRQALKK